MNTIVIPTDLSRFSHLELSALFKQTGSKRVAAALRKLSEDNTKPAESLPALPPVVAPRPNGTPKTFRAPRYSNRPRARSFRDPIIP